MGILGRLSKPNVKDLAEKRDVEGLIRALGHWDGNVRNGAVFALRGMGESAFGSLTRALNDANWRIRAGAAAVFARSREPRAVEPLTSALRDEDARVRKQAAYTLDLMGDARATEPLLAAMRNNDYAAVAGAYSFFVMRGEPGTEDTLIKALNKHGDLSMARCLLNCRNEKLKNAAQGWLAMRGYRTVAAGTTPKVYELFSSEAEKATAFMFEQGSNVSFDEVFNIFFSPVRGAKGREPTPEEKASMDFRDDLFAAYFGRPGVWGGSKPAPIKKENASS